VPALTTKTKAKRMRMRMQTICAVANYQESHAAVDEAASCPECHVG
jgi:hypothetical protein